MKTFFPPLVIAPILSSATPPTNWGVHLGGISSPQYSALSQINKTNVTRLEQAWFYPAGDNGFRFGANPIVIDGVMYLVGAHNAVVALDAATGAKIWEHGIGDAPSMNHRGVAYWEN